MGIDTIVDIHPGRIMLLEPEEAISTVERILYKFDRFKEERGCEAIVVPRQNKHLGGSWKLVSEEEAISGMNRPRRSEWYVRKPTYRRSYFMELRKELSGDGQKDYS